ncbi:hypothetical protein [Streptomyces erythrochromogenes]|uniref:hypothetical protein n=1 Tax=Streptomyces erythrochromogenes TaxID=285574 RepID=UPI0036A0EBAA
MTSVYPPLPEPFAEALGEAAHTAAMAYRLVLAISDAVRRAAQKRLTGREEELGEDAEKMAPGWSADQLRGHLGDDILAVLMQDTDWPRMARQLVGLQQAGVDLTTFLPQMGRMTAGVHQAVTANAARIKAEGTDRWADLLETTMPEGLVRDAILSSPAWPDIAAAMGRLDAAGIDVARILTDAHRAGAGVDQAVAAVTAAAANTPAPTTAPAAAAPASAAAAGARVPADDPWAPPARPIPAPAAPAPAAPAPAPRAAVGAARDVLAERMGAAGDPWAAPARPVPAPAPAPAGAPAPAASVSASSDAKRVWGPLTEGLTIPRDFDLGNQPRARRVDDPLADDWRHGASAGPRPSSRPERPAAPRWLGSGVVAAVPGRCEAQAVGIELGPHTIVLFLILLVHVFLHDQAEQRSLEPDLERCDRDVLVLPLWKSVQPLGKQ